MSRNGSLFQEKIYTSLQKAELRGRVIMPQDAEFDHARALFYGWHDRLPAAIVRAAHETDVVRVISLARENELRLAVRSGGHSLAGHSVTEGGIVLDLSEMRKIEIDAGRRIAWAQAGLTAGQYTTAAAAHGLATGFGDNRTVGIAGLTLGDEGATRVCEAYPGSTWDRLAAIKGRYDPSNFFRLNHNLPPAG